MKRQRISIMHRLMAIMASLVLAGAALADPLPLNIRTGASPNDRTGDGLRTAFTKTMSAVNALNAMRGAPGGLATLGSDGKISFGQVPAFSVLTGAPAVPTDLISVVPENGTYTAGSGAPFQAEPALGPFHGASQDLTRAQTVRYFTPSGDSNKGEYGTLLNMISRSGFPTACQRNKFYPKMGSCLNGGNIYYVRHDTLGGTTAATGSGPTGTDPNTDIVDGSVIWRYDPNFTPTNGGKSNLTLMTYQEAQSGAAWTGAFAHQIATGGPKKTAFTLELDMSNYWGDYNSAPAGPTATALQVFMGGPYRSSKAFGIGQFNQPAAGNFHTVNAMEVCCASLASDNTIIDLTGSQNGFSNLGYHAGSSFTDGSNSAISFNSYGGAAIGFRHAGASAVGLRLEGTYSGFQVQGKNWNVSPDGVITAGLGLQVSKGALKPAQYKVADLFPCTPASVGSVTVVTDLPSEPAYRGVISTGGGSIVALALCTGSAWVAH